MKQKLSVLGATGSIGTQTLEVAESCGMQVVALTTNKNATLLEVQARKFKPELVAAADLTAAADLKQRLRDTNIRVVGGEAGILEAATMGDTVVVAVVGIAGLDPTLAAIDAGKRIALANKETMVCAGDLVMKRAAEKNVDIVPVDSEHSAIFQCLQGNRAQDVKRLILTASGGPFFGKGAEELEHMTPAQALKHPNWTMGAKVTIDSATLMNKGLEFLEAMALFSVPPEKISIVVHRESIIHSLVEYCDHAMLAQLGTADMRLPIQYALTWKDRSVGTGTALDLLTLPPLTFAAPDLACFPCLALAIQAAKTGGTAPVVLNGANEIAVTRFLKGDIGFMDIPRLVAHTLKRMPVIANPTLADIHSADLEAREIAASKSAI